MVESLRNLTNFERVKTAPNIDRKLQTTEFWTTEKCVWLGSIRNVWIRHYNEGVNAPRHIHCGRWHLNNHHPFVQNVWCARSSFHRWPRSVFTNHRKLCHRNYRWHRIFIFAWTTLEMLSCFSHEYQWAVCACVCFVGVFECCAHRLNAVASFACTLTVTAFRSVVDTFLSYRAPSVFELLNTDARRQTPTHQRWLTAGQPHAFDVFRSFCQCQWH